MKDIAKKGKKVIRVVCSLGLGMFLIGGFGGNIAFSKVLSPEEIYRLPAIKYEKQKIERETGGEVPDFNKPLVKEKKKKDVKLWDYEVWQYKFPRDVMKEIKGGSVVDAKDFVKKSKKKGTVGSEKREVTGGGIGVQHLQKEVYFSGYCNPVRDYVVKNEKIYGELDCVLNVSGETRVVRVGGYFVPNLNKESLGFEIDWRRFSICGGGKGNVEVVKAGSGSPNLASSVNRRIIENVVLKTMKNTGESVSRETEKVFEDRGKQTVYSEDGVTTVVQEERHFSDIPKFAMYKAGAEVTKQIGSEVLGKIGELPPLFTVHKGENYILKGMCEIKINGRGR